MPIPIASARRLLLVLVLVLTTAAAVDTAAGPSPARAAGTVKLTGYGGDSCTAPSEAQMRAFWNNTPYSYWGVYIGGRDRACSQPNLTRTWVSDMLAMGWDILPIWVGPQNPCAGNQAVYFSTNTDTAYAQGKAEAKSAYAAWTSLSGASDVPIDYDLEAPSSNTATCRAAAKAFINGWVAQLHVAPAQVAGVYSSACAGYLDDFATIANPPDFIDAADWDNSPSTGGISCVSSSHWTQHQRHKQYQGGHNATYNGVTLNIDSRCADGQVFGNASKLSATHPCSRTATAAATPAAQRALAATQDGVAWQGARWRAGGPLDGQLQRSTGGDFAPVRLPGQAVVTHDAPVSTPTVGTPVVRADGALAVPVTEHRGSGSRLLTFTTRDGVHFTRSASRALPAELAPGVAAAAPGTPVETARCAGKSGCTPQVTVTR